jgi:hypothetical protein
MVLEAGHVMRRLFAPASPAIVPGLRNNEAIAHLHEKLERARGEWPGPLRKAVTTEQTSSALPR